MINNEIQPIIHSLIAKIDKLVPEYAANPLDAFSNGNVAVCIIDSEGNVYGKVWGTDKLRGRHVYKIAWTKASQVWITGYKTREFERKVFNSELNEKDFGIQPPDFIGWDGGQPIALKDGTQISVGFSGFRGIIDLEIVVKAVESL